MIDIPDMPDDWWPELIILRGETRVRDRVLTVSCAIDPEMLRHHQKILDESLKQMRYALWRETHTAKEPV